MDQRRTSKPIGQVPATVKAPETHSGNLAIASATGKRPKITIPAKAVQLPQIVKRPVPVQEPAFIISKPDEPIEPSKLEKKDGKKAKIDGTPQAPPAHTVRSAAGQVWQDPTLADWDPSN